METCTAPEGCDRTDIVGYDGLCRKHYQRKWTHGDPSIVLHGGKRGPETCSECERPAKALGYCTKHYRRFRVHGDPNIVGKVGNNGGQRKYTLNHDYFREIDAPDKAYWLGFLTADGSITKNSHESTLGLELAEYDAGHLLKFARDVGSDAPVKETRKNCARIRIGSFRLVDSLISLGVTGRKSLIAEPPMDKLTGLERHYWRGLWDGDGTISGRNDHRAGWTIGVVGSFACVDAFGSWARWISGCTARPNNKTSKNPDCWQWNVRGTGKPQLLAEELRLGGAGRGLDRKQVRLEELCAFDLDAHKARLNAGRAAAMRDAWATGRHPRAMKT